MSNSIINLTKNIDFSKEPIFFGEKLNIQFKHWVKYIDKLYLIQRIEYAMIDLNQNPES